jgi:hypothetical protein
LCRSYLLGRRMRSSTWVTLWLVALVNHNITNGQKNKKKKKLCERERRKTFVTLWLANIINVTNHNVTQNITNKNERMSLVPHFISKV